LGQHFARGTIKTQSGESEA